MGMKLAAQIHGSALQLKCYAIGKNIPSVRNHHVLE